MDLVLQRSVRSGGWCVAALERPDQGEGRAFGVHARNIGRKRDPPLLSSRQGRSVRRATPWRLPVSGSVRGGVRAPGRLLLAKSSVRSERAGPACASASGFDPHLPASRADQWLSLSGLEIYAVDSSSEWQPFERIWPQPNEFVTSRTLEAPSLATPLRELQLIGERTLLSTPLWFGLGVGRCRDPHWDDRDGRALRMLALATRSVPSAGQERDTCRRISDVTALLQVLGAHFPGLVPWTQFARLRSKAQAGTRLIHRRRFDVAISQRPWSRYGWNQVSVAQSAVAASHPHRTRPLNTATIY